MVTLVKTYRQMDKEKRIFDLIIEESDSFIYITIRDEVFIKAVEVLVDKHSSLIEYTRNHNAFSFRIHIDSFIDNSGRTRPVKQNLYQNELVSAKELMIICSDDIEIYVNELHEALLDYRSLCNDDNTYNASMQLILKNLFDQYTRLFKKVPEFDRVSIALQSVAVLIKNSKMKKFDKDKNTQIIRHLEELHITIEIWINNVITNQSSKDVHYSDHKIMSNCRQIEKDFS